MSLTSRAKRLQREAERGAILVRLRDGTTKAFTEMQCFQEMFLASTDCLRGVARGSEVLEAVRAATPQSRREFEERFSGIRMETKIVDRSGEVRKVMVLTEDGEALTLDEAGEVIESGPREIEDLSEP